MDKASDLLALSEEDFRSVVDHAVRESNSHLAPLLRDPAVVNRWYYHLVAMKKSVEGQLAAKRAESLAARAAHAPHDTAAHERWRAGALRFKAGVESQLLEARALRESTREGWTITHLMHERNSLIAAILAHRDHICTSSCDNECTADAALWSLVSEPQPAED